MSKPYSIKMFRPAGDPDGLRATLRDTLLPKLLSGELSLRLDHV
jgi:hypothetical protein